MAYWLVKTEPETYAWATLVKDGGTSWGGVRNYTARNNLRAMRRGDACFVYHSVGPRQIVGIAEVSRESYPDPTVPPNDPEQKKGWLAVDIAPVRVLPAPVSLEQVKAHKLLQKMELVRQSRLSVAPVSEAEWRAVLALAEAPQPEAPTSAAASRASAQKKQTKKPGPKTTGPNKTTTKAAAPTRR